MIIYFNFEAKYCLLVNYNSTISCIFPEMAVVRQVLGPYINLWNPVGVSPFIHHFYTRNNNPDGVNSFFTHQFLTCFRVLCSNPSMQKYNSLKVWLTVLTIIIILLEGQICAYNVICFYCNAVEASTVLYCMIFHFTSQMILYYQLPVTGHK